MKSVIYKDISADNYQFRAWMNGANVMLEWETHRKEILGLMFARSVSVQFMQWIGMIDDSDAGRKMYENDLVEVEVDSGFGSMILMKGIVAFDPSQSGFRIKFPKSGMGQVEIGKVIVIGDTFRNPGLWEEIRFKEPDGGQQINNGSQKNQSGDPK